MKKAKKFDIKKSSVFHRRLNYDYPVITHGKGIYLYDENGKRYIDAVGGALVNNLGNGIKQVAKVIEKWAEKISFLHASQFTTRHMEEYAKKLCRVAPKGLNRVYFVSGGSEVVETAIKLAKQYHWDAGNKGKYKIIYTIPGYHGSTMGALAITPKKSFREIFEVYLQKQPHIPFPSYFCYHCPYKKTYPDCGIKCAWELEKKIKKEGANNVAAFIVEPIIGASAGAVVPPKEYFSIVRYICNKYNVLLIADEVMSGSGRSGKWFACQHFKVVPDILITAKGISSGFVPFAAMFCTDKIFNTIKKGTGAFSHGFTYANNSLTTAVGNAVFDYMQKNHLVEKCAKSGKYLLSKLQELKKFDIVGDVRGLGLMTAVEFVKNRQTKQPFDRKVHLAEKILQAAMRKGLNLYFALGFVDGTNGDAVMVAPPYNVSKKEIDEIEAKLAATRKKMEGHLKELGFQ